MKIKLFIVGMIGIVSISLLWLFFTAKPNHDIPLGEYIETTYGADTFMLRGDYNYDWFWVIKNNNANYYASGILTYKSDIVEREGKMYLEGKTWFDFIFWREKGEVFTYEITYNPDNGYLTIVDMSD